MKNIRLYETEVDYTSEKDTHEYPTVSYCEENDVVYYLQKQASAFEFVDLGLPSGLKWATCNVGASKPEEFGLYFAWGETQGYTGITDEKQFKWADYKWSSDADGTTMTKYNETDELLTLEAADDAATAVDSGCRMPTIEELRELTANTTSAWTEVNGVYGCQLTSKNNGNFIFVPAAGKYEDGSVVNVGENGNGYLWSSSLLSSGQYAAQAFNSFQPALVLNSFSRYGGMSVRPVKK